MPKVRSKPVRDPEKIRAKRLRYKENVKQRKARLLQVTWGGMDGTYLVSSSSDSTKVHVVTQGPDGLFGEGNDCDCHNGQHACSHVLAARLFRERTAKEVARNAQTNLRTM